MPIFKPEARDNNGDDVDAGPAYSPDDQKKRDSTAVGRRIRDPVVSTCGVHDPNKEMSSQSEELLHSVQGLPRQERE